MSDRRFAVIAGGGTAGHVLPALAIARALADRGHDRSDIELMGSRRSHEELLATAEGFALTRLTGRGLVRRVGPAELIDNVGAVAGVAWATAEVLGRFARRQPRVVVSVGGYASFPAALSAVVLGIPLVLVNVDAVPGLVHRLLGRFAAASAVALPGTPLPRAIVTGTPVRDEVAAVRRSPEDARAARAGMGLPPDRKTVAVFGGSLGAARLNRTALALAERWRNRGDLTVYHVSGRRDWPEVSAAAAGLGPAALYYRAVAYQEDMAALYRAADLVVSRAGAMTVAELAVAGVPAVLVPLPGAPGDHQTANARVLVEAGAAELLPDAECDAARLDPLVGSLLADTERLSAMAAGARSLGRPDAAARVAEVVEANAR